MNKQINSLVLKHRASDYGKLHDFITENIRSDNIPTEIGHDLRLATEEIFSNIINHADITSQDNKITIELTVTTLAIKISFKDSGKAFNPICSSGINMLDNDHSEGGMGIHLIKSLTDQQEYKRIDQQNVFTVTKYYNH